jgi:hypothetical protein
MLLSLVSFDAGERPAQVIRVIIEEIASVSVASRAEPFQNKREFRFSQCTLKQVPSHLIALESMPKPCKTGGNISSNPAGLFHSRALKHPSL